MKTNNPMAKGKAIEHYFISELLKNDFEIFIPVLDTGTDMIIKDREGGFVEIQVKSRIIKTDEDCFVIKDFVPKNNFFIICHDISTNDFFCMPSSKFFQKSELIEEQGKKKRQLTNLKLRKHSWCKNEKGMALLRKALENRANRISGFLENGD